MPQVLRTNQAEEDLVDILAHLGQYSPKAAERFAAEVERTCRVLAQSPGIGRSREELAPGLRSIPAGKYLLFYKPIDDGIELVRVVYGPRHLPSLFRD
jgi:toxin ParE1/3/4